MRDLRVSEACGVAVVLLRRDAGEDAAEMLVLDDDAGHEPRVIAGMQRQGRAQPGLLQQRHLGAVLPDPSGANRGSIGLGGRCHR